MYRKTVCHILLLGIILILPFGVVSGQKTLDHEVFLQKIANSSDNIYRECISEYDAYLEKFPDDVAVMVEKCKFIQYAQYDEEADYNPNQAEFDSCSASLIKRYPLDTEVLLFEISYLWGEDLEQVFEKAEASVKENPGDWNNEELAALYKAISENYYYDDENNQALDYIEKAIANDTVYSYFIDYARILLELNRKKEALDVLLSVQDTTEDTWRMSMKADMLLKLEAYQGALDVYHLIEKTDSTYNNNHELASALEGAGQYEPAREYLVADTAESWDKEGAVRDLLRYDLKHQDGSVCYESYNNLRDFGYLTDPIGLYRIKLFFLHPFQPWKFRDIIGILSLLVLLGLLAVIPYIWILPIHYLGKASGSALRKKPYEPAWGLKMFWFVSAGYLIASLFASVAEPETLYTLVNSSYFDRATEMTSTVMGHESLIFIIILAVFGFAAMYKVKPRVLLGDSWSVRRSLFMGLALLFAFKIASGIYIRLGMEKFDISIDDLASIPNIVLASKQEIEAIITTFGKLPALLLIGLLVPVYEEIIFRGVVLDACTRNMNFNVANILQASVFSLVHGSVFLFPAFFLFGILTGSMRKRSGGLLPGIIFHAFNNISVLLVLFLRQ